MATIKSYTDIEQSKKLAEILPLESADMVWEQHGAEPYVTIKPWTTIGKSIGCHCLSCWSLSSLLSVLPMIAKDKEIANPFIAKTPDNEYYVVYATLTKEVDSSGIYDNPIDACYEMIILLSKNELI